MSRGPKKQPPAQTFLALAILLYLIAVAAIQFNSIRNPVPKEGSAWYSCAILVEQQLGVPAREAQRHTRGLATSLTSDQYQVDVYYPEQQSIYRCEFRRHSTGVIELLSLHRRD